MNTLRSARAPYVLALLLTILGLLSTATGAQAGVPPGTPRDLHIITPCRIYDSRLLPGDLTPGTTHTFDLPPAGPSTPDRCGVPTDAASVIINAMIISDPLNPPPVTPARTGFVSVFKGGTPPPSAGVVSFEQGDVLGQFLAVQLGADPAPDLEFKVVTDLPAGTFDVAIDVLAYNGSGAPADILLSDNTVEENQPVGTLVGTLSTTDPDFDDTHTYTLVSGAGSTDNAKFQISGNQLLTNAILDLKGQPTYSIRVRSTDHPFGVFLEEVFIISADNVNEAPAGTDGTISVSESGTRSFTAADFGFTDPIDNPDNNFLAVVITTVPDAGLLELSDVAVLPGQSVLVADIPNLTFTPVPGENGTPYTSFTFQVQDDGGTANGGVDLDPTPNTLTINVNSVNDAPAGADNTVTINEDGSHTFTAAEFGFSDPNDAPAANAFLAVRITTLPTAGSLTLSGSPVSAGQSIPVASIPNLVFTPAANANGSPYGSFTFQVQDDGGTAGGGVDLDQSPNLFTFNVTAVNDPPAGTDKTITILEDTPYTFTAADFGFTDPLDTPAANALQAVVITTLPTAGSLTLSGGPVSAGQSIPVASIPNLVFTPAANASGTGYASFTFQVRDDGGTANGGIDLDASANTITFDVTAVNDEPTLDPIPDPADVNEDAGLQTVNLTGIGAGGAGTESSQTLTVTAVSSNPALIPNPTVVYTSPNATGSLSYTPVANQSGTAVITVTVQDDGGTANGGDDTIQRTFTVDVLNINDEPTLDPITDPADILEEAGLQTVNLTGIAADALGVETSQTLTVTAVSSNPGLIPNPTVTYTSPNATGSLSYTPVANQFGTAVITVTVQDNGGTANGGDDTIQRTFTVDVLPVNDEPTLDPIADPADINEDAGLQTVNLTGIGAGGAGTESSQTLTVTAVSSNPSLIPNPTVTYTSPNATGSLSYTPVANQFGTAVITVTVQDNGGTANGGDDTIQRTFTVDVLNINDEPTLDPIADPADILEDAGLQTVNLAGIGAGGAGTETSQVLTVTAVSSNPGLIPNPTVVYTSPNATGSLSYTPVANQFGSAVITVTVQDNGGTANGGDDTIQRTFTVDVLPVNDAPSFVAGGPVTVDEDSGAYSAAWASGISAGPANESGQTLTFQLSGTPSPTDLFSVAPSISSAGVLTFTPALNKFGSATYTVVLQDNGGTANGGVNTSTSVNLTITVNPVNDAPIADNDKFDYIGNTELRVDLAAGLTPAASETTPTTFGVVDGDSDPVENDAIAVSSITVGSCTDNSAPFDCTDPAVGTVHMQPNGRFSFEPAAGDTGSAPTATCPGALDQETFQYTLTDNGTPLPASTTATVTLCRFARVWFVDPAGAAGNGTSASPLNALTSLNGAGGAGDVDGTGDYIFIHSGTLAGTIELEGSQHLIGRGSALSIPANLNENGSPTVLVTAGTRPQLTNASGDTVRVTGAIPANIVGLSLASTTGNAIDLTSAAALTGSSTLTIGNNQFRGAGAEGIDVNLNAGTTGTLTLNVSNNSWDAAGTHTGNAVDIGRTAGNLRLDFSNNTGVVSAATAVSINGGAAANTTITGFANNTVHQNTAGTGIFVTNATFDADPSAANLQTVSGGTTMIGTSGDGVGGGGLSMSAVTGDLAFTDLDVFTSGGGAISVAGTGAFTGSAGTRLTVTSGVATADATGGPAAAISSATIDLQLANLRSLNSASTGVSLTSVAGTFSAPSSSSITNAGTTDFVIDSTSAAVTYDGTITDDVGQLVSVTNSGGSNKLFRGAITDGDDGDGNGISLTGNSSLIRFSGGVVLSTGANAAFTATGGGTVEVCDEEPCNPGAAGLAVNRITTTTGTALNVANTTIGSNNLEFQRISAGTGSGSSGVGISLDNTGTAAGNGGLVVRGTGTAGSGGTIQRKTGADGSTTAGLGIYLNRTRAASFSRMQLNDFDNFAIRANEIVGLTLSDVVVSGLNGNSAAADEGSIFLEDAGGTIAVSSTNVSGGFEDNLRVLYDNATAGPAAVYNVTGSTFRDLQAAGNNSLVNLRSATSAATGWDVDFNFTGSCVFENDARTLPPGGTENFADALLITFEGPFQHSLNVQNANFHHLFQAMDIASNFSADVAYVLKDNTITFTEGVAAIAIGSGSSSTSESLLTGLIQGNNIGTSGVAQSGNRLGLGIALDMRGEEIAQFTVHGNTIRRTEVNGIQVIGQTAADGNLDIQITNNNIAEIEDDGGAGAGVIYGIEVTTNASTSHDICLDARNNDSFNINAHDIRVRQSNAAVTFAIEGLTGSGASDVNVENYLVSQNPGNTADVRTGGSVVNYTSVANCTTPPIQ